MAQNNPPVLRFHEDGTFRILMVSDFHAGENCNPKLIAGLEALLENTRPDFVMIGGDQCLNRQTPEAVRAYFCEIIEPILRRNLPWAAIFGNHDRETGLDIETEQRIYETVPGCLGTRGPEQLHGVGNFCLPVLAHDSDQTAYRLWAFDSHRSITDYTAAFGLPENTRYILPRHFNDGEDGAGVLYDQIAWYYKNSLAAERETGHKIPGVMFMHIPLPEYLLIYRNPEECDARGSKRASIGASELNTGLFFACLQRGDIRGIFFGHEHLTDLQGEYCGITMACDAALGYNMSAHDDLRGGRVIDLFEDGRMSTHAVKLWDIMGKACMRDPDYMEGGCRYFIRKLD